MLVDSSHPNTRRGWGVWRSAPHCGLYLIEMHGTKSAALASAVEQLKKGWGDYFIVRKIILGSEIVEIE